MVEPTFLNFHRKNSPPNSRDNSGRFIKGNPGGPGNPHAKRSALLKKAFLDNVSEGMIQEIVWILFSKASKGDLAAAKLLLDYSIGSPQQSPALEASEDEVEAERFIGSLEVNNRKEVMLLLKDQDARTILNTAELREKILKVTEFIKVNAVQSAV